MQRNDRMFTKLGFLAGLSLLAACNQAPAMDEGNAAIGAAKFTGISGHCYANRHRPIAQHQ